MAFEAGAGTPQPYEIVRTGDGFGVVVEYVRGLGLLQHIVFGSYTPKEAGQAMTELMHHLHGVRVAEGRDVNATFHSYTRTLAPLLPGDVGERLVSLVDAIPRSQTLIHGDLHIGNVVICHGEPTPIDMELAGFGHPIFDLAITRARLLLNTCGLKLQESRDLEQRTRSEVWESLLAAYSDAAGWQELQELDRMPAAIAEVEYCCFNYSVGRTGGVIHDRQQRQVDLCAERLRALLSDR